MNAAMYSGKYILSHSCDRLFLFEKNIRKVELLFEKSKRSIACPLYHPRIFRLVETFALANRNRVEAEKMQWSRNLGEFHGPRTRMKIHERLKSKAVDIHILKMASLTLNGHHYALTTNATVCFTCACIPHTFSGEVAGYMELYRGARVFQQRRRWRQRHCSLACDDRRSSSRPLSFRAVPFVKGCDSGYNSRRRDRRPPITPRSPDDTTPLGHLSFLTVRVPAAHDNYLALLDRTAASVGS